MNKPKGTVEHIRSIFVSTAVKQLGRFLSGYISALLLGPSLFGLWNGSRLIIDYGAYLNLGTLYAMERQIPYYKGADEKHKIRAVEYNSFVVNTGGILLGALVTLITGVSCMEGQLRFTVVTVSLILFAQYMGTFYQYHLRANQLFTSLATNSFVDFLGSMIAIGATVLMGYAGFLAGFLLRTLIIWYSAARSSPFIFNWSMVKDYLDITVLKELFKFGLPIMAVGLVSLAYQSLDRMVILKYLDIQQLGFYSLSTVITIPLSLINRSVIGVLYPKMSKDFGASGDMKILQRYILKPSKAIVCMSSIFVGFFHIALPFLVYIFLPQYREGVEAATILIYAMVFSFIYGIHIQFFTSIGRQGQYLIIVCIMFVVKLVLSVFLLNAGYSINGVAFASFITEYLTYLAMVIISQRLIQSLQREIVQEILTTTAIVAYVFISCLGIKKVMAYTDAETSISIALKNMAVQEGFIILCITPIALVLYRLLGKETITKMFSLR